MSLICDCPLGAAIGDIPISACPETIGQIQKVVFQRVYSSGATKNTLNASTANPNVLATWTPLLAAVDGTKVVQSPYLQNPVFTPGGKKAYGENSNETLGGTGVLIGRDPTQFTANLLNCSQGTVKALKDYQCETIGVYLIDDNGRIGLLADDRDTPTEYYPIPIHMLFIGDKNPGGFDQPGMNAIEWKFYPNWSDNLVWVEPTDFNALSDLVTPEGS